MKSCSLDSIAKRIIAAVKRSEKTLGNIRRMTRLTGKSFAMNAASSDTTHPLPSSSPAGATGSGLRIFVYTVCWNEEKFLPYFLRHYAAFAEKIVVYDNGSTDASPQIVRDFPKAELRQFDTGGTFNDLANVEIKNEAYKEARGIADFVIVVDADELLYHPRLNEVLSRYKSEGVTLPLIDGYNMFAWMFPRGSRPITDLVRFGRSAPWYGKRIIFRPDVEIKYNPCCHICYPEGPVMPSKTAELKLLHYHYMGYGYNLKKHRDRGRRLSQYNLKRNLGIEYHWGFMRIFGRFVVFMANSHDVIREKRSLIATLCGWPVNFIKSWFVKDEPS